MVFQRNQNTRDLFKKVLNFTFNKRSFYKWSTYHSQKDLFLNRIKMAKYTFQINEFMDEFRLIDSWQETINSPDVFTALDDIKRAYPQNKGYECQLIKNELW